MFSYVCEVYGRGMFSFYSLAFRGEKSTERWLLFSFAHINSEYGIRTLTMSANFKIWNWCLIERLGLPEAVDYHRPHRQQRHLFVVVAVQLHTQVVDIAVYYPWTWLNLRKNTSKREWRIINIIREWNLSARVRTSEAQV